MPSCWDENACASDVVMPVGVVLDVVLEVVSLDFFFAESETL